MMRMFLLRKVRNMNSETLKGWSILLMLGTTALAWTARVVLQLSHYDNDHLEHSHTDGLPFL